MKVGPRYKICRRLGPGVFEKCQTQKFALREARGGRERHRRSASPRTDYGIQQREKQRVRFTYGISEHQFAQLVKKAVAKRGVNSVQELFAALEHRLDNIVFRVGLAETRRHARQIVSHGHITVNGTRINAPSHRVQTGTTVAIREGSKRKTLFAATRERAEKQSVPEWLLYDAEKKTATVTGTANPGQGEALLDLASVIEFYSR